MLPTTLTEQYSFYRQADGTMLGVVVSEKEGANADYRIRVQLTNGEYCVYREVLQGSGPRMQLLSIQCPPPGSQLEGLARTMGKLDNLSHCLVWGESTGGGTAVIREVECPRLKLKWKPMEVDGVMKLFCLNYASLGLYLCGQGSDCPELRRLARGVVHSCYLENAVGEVYLLVPSHPMKRMKMSNAPFVTEYRQLRGDPSWQSNVRARTHLYQVQGGGLLDIALIMLTPAIPLFMRSSLIVSAKLCNPNLHTDTDEHWLNTRHFCGR